MKWNQFAVLYASFGCGFVVERRNTWINQYGERHKNYQFHAGIHHNGWINPLNIHHVVPTHPEINDARVRSWNNFFRTNGQQLLRFPQTHLLTRQQQNGNLIKISRKSVVFEAFTSLVHWFSGKIEQKQNRMLHVTPWCAVWETMRLEQISS